ncbi:hypothetical protein evm_013522 [Chilo suppressalis]|nr:hypothetical protein evm_013522 [Chilo suppressalis]
MERKVIRSAAREVILKVKQFCELEKKNNNVLIPLQNVQMRVAAMTGVSVKTVSRSKEGKTAMATSNKKVTPGKSRPPPLHIIAFRLTMLLRYQAQNHICRSEAAFASVTPEDWSVQCNHVEHLEDEYFKNDGLVDVEMERFIISTESDSDTESDDSTEEELSNSDCDISGVKELYHDDHNYCIKLY